MTNPGSSQWIAVASVLVCAVLLGGCSSNAAGPLGPHPAGPGLKPGSGSGGDARGGAHGVRPGPASAKGKTVPRPSAIPVTGAACDARPCVYHGGAKAYFSCLSGGDGMCFHFGARCKPSSTCLFDAASNRYKVCTKLLAGECKTFAAECAAPDGCAYDPADGRYHVCEQATGGACGSFGPPCDPS